MARSAWILPALLTSGCFFPDVASSVAGSASDWYETGPVKRPHEEITRATRDIVSRQGYTVTTFDEREGRLETDWVTNMSSHWREGFRTKIEAEFVRVPGSGTKIRVRSRREVNDESRNPMAAERARWISAAFDEKQKPKIPEPAIRIDQLLKFKFQGMPND